MARSVRRLLVVLAVVGAGLVPAPAGAAQCSGNGGVSVVVDFNHGAGGGIQTACDPGGGGKVASAIFDESGFTLTYASGQPFVCTVKGKPEGVTCPRTPPPDAYWGLFWAKPGASSWSYASLGVTSLKIPEGGSVAFAFQDGGSTDYPGVAPAKRTTSSPKPSPTPTTKPATSTPTKKPGSGASTAPRPGAATPSASTSASATPSGTPTSTASASASGSASGSASASAGAAAAPSSDVSPPEAATATGTTTLAEPDDGGGLPWWVPVAVLLGLGGGGAAAWRTRRQRTT